MAMQIEVKPIKSKSFIESEAYKKLRTNIQFSGNQMKAIAITSVSPNDGKSEISFKLAWSLAKMDKKTIYVDADLRNSKFLIKHEIHQELKGLAHYLVGENTVDDVITKTQNPNLDIISIGAFPPNPSELLSQDIYKELISELRERYDYVVIDTPPSGLVIDGVIASAAADGVILVISSGNTTQKSALSVLSVLEKAKCKVIGCVLNKCGQKGTKAMSYGGYYGYNGYGSYGSYGTYGGYGGYGHEYDYSSKTWFDKLKSKFKKHKNTKSN